MPSRGTTSSRWSCGFRYGLRRRGGDLSIHRPLTHNCCALTHPLLITCTRDPEPRRSGPAVPAGAMLRRPASARLMRSTAPCRGN